MLTKKLTTCNIKRFCPTETIHSFCLQTVSLNSTKALIISLRLTSQQPIIQPLLREIQAPCSLHERNLVLINQLVDRGNGKAQHLRCFIDCKQLVLLLNIQSPCKLLADDGPNRGYDSVIRKDMGESETSIELNIRH